jgi:hypothetical protein
LDFRPKKIYQKEPDSNDNLISNEEPLRFVPEQQKLGKSKKNHR